MRIPVIRGVIDRRILVNFRAVIDELNRVKPSAAKGKYIKSVAVSSTMGPGIDVDTNRLRVTDEELACSR